MICVNRARSSRRTAFGAGSLMAVLLTASSVMPVLAQDDPFGNDWPQGEGRELTGAFCGGCHSLNLVKQQGLTRDGWDVLLHWMTDKQKMPPIQGEMRDTVLDYLAMNFNVDHGANPGTLPGDGEGDLVLNPVQGINHLPALEIRPAD